MGAERVLVVGCGGIGGTVLAHLAELGVDAHGLSRNHEVVRAAGANGLRLVGESEARTVRAPIHSRVPAGQSFDYVLLATQPTDVEAAAGQVAEVLAPEGRVVCFQNGLCEARVAEVLGRPDAVLGGIIAWGATMVEPAVYDKTSSGGFVLGRHDGQPDAALDTLATWFESIGPVQRTDNLRGARWSKLALNCVVSSLGTLNGSRLGAVVRQRTARRLALEIITEVVAVAQRAQVRLEKVSGTLDLEWMALKPEERTRSLASKHGMLMAVGLRYRRLYSSMLRAIQKGRRPAIDFLNGEVVRWGGRVEVPVPVNQAVVDAVWDIANGVRDPGKRLIERIHEGTR